MFIHKTLHYYFDSRTLYGRADILINQLTASADQLSVNPLPVLQNFFASFIHDTHAYLRSLISYAAPKHNRLEKTQSNGANLLVFNSDATSESCSFVRGNTNQSGGVNKTCSGYLSSLGDGEKVPIKSKVFVKSMSDVGGLFTELLAYHYFYLEKHNFEYAEIKLALTYELGEKISYSPEQFAKKIRVISYADQNAAASFELNKIFGKATKHRFAGRFHPDMFTNIRFISKELGLNIHELLNSCIEIGDNDIHTQNMLLNFSCRHKDQENFKQKVNELNNMILEKINQSQSSLLQFFHLSTSNDAIDDDVLKKIDEIKLLSNEIYVQKIDHDQAFCMGKNELIDTTCHTSRSPVTFSYKYGFKMQPTNHIAEYGFPTTEHQGQSSIKKEEHLKEAIKKWMNIIDNLAKKNENNSGEIQIYFYKKIAKRIRIESIKDEKNVDGIKELITNHLLDGLKLRLEKTKFYESDTHVKKISYTK